MRLKSMHKVLIKLAAYGLVFLPALALPNSNNACVKRIDFIVQMLNRVELMVPFVPPEEKDYFAKETKASMETKSASRFNALTTRPYYYAWKLHSAFNAAYKDLLAIKKLPANASIKLKLQTAHDVPYVLSNARDSWNDYVEYRGNNLTSKQARYGYVAVVVPSIEFGSYINCLAGQL